MDGQKLRQSCVWIIALAAVGALSPVPALAVSIAYTATPLPGNNWQYDYTITNNGLPASADLAGFQIFFDPVAYENLTVISSPAGWDVLVFEPDADIFLSGVLDGLASPGPGIPDQEDLGGFKLSFTWLAAGTPAGQPFLIYEDLTGGGCDPDTEDCFPVVFPAGGIAPAEPGDFLCGSGSVCTVDVAAVPAPPGIWLIGTALAAVLARVRRR